MNFPFDPGLETKQDFMQCMRRIYAWYDQAVIDRIPIRFAAHNAEFDTVDNWSLWPNKKARWFDAEYQVDKALSAVEGGSYLGETFPLFWPNLGPNVFAGMMGAGLAFGDVTSWALPAGNSGGNGKGFQFNPQNEYLQKLNEMTDLALEKCKGKCLVGYTDLHPSLDCVDALMGTEAFFLTMVDEPETIKSYIQQCFEPFFPVIDRFHQKLFANRQPSVTWMQIPSFEGMHIPSCDLGAMMSTEMFNEFSLPFIKKEVRHFRHNIFHVDGKGVAKHLDALMEIPEIQAFQWVQGVGNDRPIMQWVPLIQKIQAGGKSVVVDLHLSELDPFMDAVRPEGILICMDESSADTQQAVLEKLLTWK